MAARKGHSAQHVNIYGRRAVTTECIESGFHPTMPCWTAYCAVCPRRSDTDSRPFVCKMQQAVDGFVNMPNGGTTVPKRPCCKQHVVFVLCTVDYVGDNSPGGAKIKPRLNPMKVSGPIGRLVDSPKRERPVIQHDGLSYFMASLNLRGCGERNTETATHQFGQNRSWCYRCSVVVHCHAVTRCDL